VAEKKVLLKIINENGKIETFRFFTVFAAQQVADELKKRENIKTIINED